MGGEGAFNTLSGRGGEGAVGSLLEGRRMAANTVFGREGNGPLTQSLEGEGKGRDR